MLCCASECFDDRRELCNLGVPNLHRALQVGHLGTELPDTLLQVVCQLLGTLA